MAFVKFQKSAQPATAVATVTVTRSGSLSLSRASYLLIDSPEAVEMFWDAERRLVGIGPATLDTPGAYPVRPNGTGESQRGPLTVGAVAFTKQFVGMDLSVARRWPARVEEGMLIFDTSEPGQEIKSNRTIAAERREADAAQAST